MNLFSLIVYELVMVYCVCMYVCILQFHLVQYLYGAVKLHHTVYITLHKNQKIFLFPFK